MNNVWLSILPPIITIAVAIWSRKILPSLLLGLLVGSYLLNPTIIGGLETSVESIIKILSDKDNLQVLLFLYLFSGLIALIRKAGGIAAFSSWISKYVKTEKRVFFTLWALIPVTFIDCAFRIIGTGSIIRNIAEKNKVSKDRLAFMINNTASPIIELIPIATTFVGFNIANINQGLKAAGILEKKSAYNILLHAIPYEFFSIVVLIITFSTIYFQWKKPTNEQATPRSVQKPLGEMNMSMAMDDDEPEIKPRIINLAVPMLTVIFFSLFFFRYFGAIKAGANATLTDIITLTDPNKAMLLALFATIIVTGIIFSFQKYSLKKMTADIISGGNELMNILAILVVAWSLGAVSQELNLSSFIQQQIGSSLPVWSIPAALFVISSIVTYFIGEGWAAASLIMPFAISIAVTSGFVLLR
jgi:tetracycline resistance efflux pump